MNTHQSATQRLQEVAARLSIISRKNSDELMSRTAVFLERLGLGSAVAVAR